MLDIECLKNLRVVLGLGEAFSEETVSFLLSKELKNSEKQLEPSEYIDRSNNWVDVQYKLWC